MLSKSRVLTRVCAKCRLEDGARIVDLHLDRLLELLVKVRSSERVGYISVTHALPEGDKCFMASQAHCAYCLG